MCMCITGQLAERSSRLKVQVIILISYISLIYLGLANLLHRYTCEQMHMGVNWCDWCHYVTLIWLPFVKVYHCIAHNILSCVVRSVYCTWHSVTFIEISILYTVNRPSSDKPVKTPTYEEMLERKRKEEASYRRFDDPEYSRSGAE